MSENRTPDDDRTIVEGSGPAGGAAGSDAPVRVEGYRLIRELGRGGMGAVYLAEQLEPVQRQVALKVIGTRQRGGSVDAALFEVERQMLARMHHPAIAQVFDAGTAEDGRPFFAMEWVRGEPIVDHAGRHDLSERERLALFIRVCQGIQHAHQQGVIHRDIKPGNILVDRVDGVSMPKIIDFGVATGVVEGEQGRQRSESTDRAGTRGYMSPELLSGPAVDVDTRTDVYSLGVLLFELLTDRRPPPGDDTAALEYVRDALVGTTRRTDSGDAGAAPLVARSRQLPRELRWILARALDPDRDRRYESAAALAADLRRYLDRQVVEAVPQTRAYRWRKFLARNALAVGAVGAVTVALAAGLIVAIASLVEARSQAARAEQIADFTTDMLSSIDPEVADGAETPVLDRVLADAAERVRSELSGQPRIRAEMELTIGTVHARMGAYERAREHLGTALELLADREPVDLYLAAGTELALIDVQESKLGAAEGRVDELLSLAERHRPETREAWLDLLSVRGTIRSEQARHEEALALFDRVIEAIGENPAPDVADVRIIAMRQKGQTYSEMMNLEAADEWFGRALEAASERDEPNIRAIASGLLNDRGVVLLRQQRYAEAEAVLRQAVAETERLYGERHPRAIVQYGNLAGAIRQQGGEAKLAQALPFYEKARSLALERYGPDHPQSVAFTYNLGNAYREAERIDEALAMHRQALARRNAFPDGHLFHGLVHLGLGQSEQLAGNLDTAGEHLQTAVDRLGELMGEDFFRRIEAMRSLAEVHAALGAPDLARSLRAEARRLGGEPADD